MHFFFKEVLSGTVLKQYYQEQPYKLYERNEQELEQSHIKICSVEKL